MKKHRMRLSKGTSGEMKSAGNGRGNLVVNLVATLRNHIEVGDYPIGSRLPSEAQLTAQHGVSRTVVREAVAALRADGFVEPKQGAGVFVTEPPAAPDLPFRNIDPTRVSSVLEMLELRIAIEVEMAGLAAQRRSPVQEENIVNCHRAVSGLVRSGDSTAEADFALHLSIADATNNPRFREFLEMLGPGVIPRRALRSSSSAPVSSDYQSMIDSEHERIVNAIIDGDTETARAAMRKHLDGSISRYRTLLMSSRPDPSNDI